MPGNSTAETPVPSLLRRAYSLLTHHRLLMASPESSSKRSGFRRTLLFVLAVQVFTLLLLWLLQLRYHV